MSILKIYIVDDHQMLIDGLKALLSGETHLSVIGQNTLPKIASQEIAKLCPDIVLTDINMPEMDGIELTKEIKPQRQIYILFLTSNYKINRRR